MKTPNKVWSKFVITKQDGTTVKLKVHDVTKEKSNAVDEFMGKFFLFDETFMKTAGMKKNDEAMKEYRMIQRMLLEQDTTYALVCSIDKEDDDDLEIVGVNILYEDKGEIIDLKWETAEVFKFFDILAKVQTTYRPCEELNVPKYLAGAGLSVDPDYRCCGIATKILKARVLLGKELGIKMVGAFFSSTGSQIAAERAGYKTTFEMSYEDLGRICGYIFENTSKTYTFMMVMT